MSVETIRELVAKIGLEVDEKAFKVAETLIAGLKTGLAATIGAAAGAGVALLAMAQSTANAANEARKGALRTGLTTDAYQELKFAAEAAGADVGSLETALFRMSRASYQARHGSAAAAQAFHGLLTLGDLKNGTPDEQFEKMADGLAKIKDPGERANRAMTIFGRGIQPLLPLLARGKEGIEELRQELRESGALIGPETIANAKEYAENLHKTEVMLDGLKYQLGGAVLGALVKFQRWVHKTSEAFKEWRKANPEFFVKGFRLIAAGLVALAIANAGAVASMIGAWLTLASEAIATAATVAVSWAIAAAPFIGTAIAVGLLALALEDLYGFITGKQSVIGDFLNDLKAVTAEWHNWKDALQDIAGFLRNGIFREQFDKALGSYAGTARGIAGASPFPVTPFIGESTFSAPGVRASPTYVPAGVNVTVNAAPGMDEKAVAQHVVQVVQDELDKITREAQAAAQ